MDEKLMYIHNYQKQNYHFSRLKLLVKIFRHQSFNWDRQHIRIVRQTKKYMIIFIYFIKSVQSGIYDSRFVYDKINGEAPILNICFLQNKNVKDITNI